ncbi:TesB-like acyl-CoA thioesterase 1 [Labilithrix luteola]|uniref:TesB-like acyl-CoA thioesterase 1 n=1 Tax=Labilithrix luteola TaxID=1391654 RepID=A0A0K1Q4H3_9BACT|nr:thioesterase family protein [Labilithrix luteola]AKV00706.1 TesB-like acyl-CoA thioesterase 1 [Labilithrix luteola]
MDFSQATAIERLGDGIYRLDVPDGWHQGVGAYGGVVLGALTRALADVCRSGSSDEARPLRTLTATIAGPLRVGPAEVRVEPIRVGKGVSVLAGKIVQGSELPAHAVGTFGRTRPTDADGVALVKPTARDYRVIEPIAANGVMPEFTQHFEFRIASGVPFSGGPEAVTTGWIKPRVPVTPDEALVVGLADAWWPSQFTRMTTPRYIVTLTFTLQIFAGASAIGDAPLLFTSRTMAAAGGYLTEARELWTEDGQLVALNQQTMAIVK